MMNYAELATLERALRDRLTLSVYLDGQVASPATRTAWRRRLENALAEVGSSLLHADAEERSAFESACALLLERLAPFTGALGSVGWAAFVTADAVHVGEPMSVPLTASVTWDRGMRAVPLLRSLKVHRGAMVCVADTRAVRLLRYRRGKLERLATHRGIDREGGERQVHEIADRLLELSSRDDWLVFGGAPAHATALAAAVPPRLARRAVVMPPLSALAGEFEIAQGVERAVASLRRAYESAIVDALLLRSSAGGCSVTTPARTRWALRESSVEELVLTRRFCERQADLAEELVRDALDRGALLEEVSGAAAERLDAAGGVGALLSAGYRTPSGGVAVVVEEAGARY